MYSNETTARPMAVRYDGNRALRRGRPDLLTWTVFHNGERSQWRMSAGWLLVTLMRWPSARCSSATAATDRMPMPMPWKSGSVTIRVNRRWFFVAITGNVAQKFTGTPSHVVK